MRKNRQIAKYTIVSDNTKKELVAFAHNELEKMPEPDAHENLEITVFLTCEGIYNISGRDIEFRPSDIFLMPSNAKHAISKLTKSGTIYNMAMDKSYFSDHISLYDDESYLSIFRGNIAYFQNRLDRENPSCKKIVELMHKIYDEFREKKRGYKHMVRIYIQTILVTIYRDFDYGKESSNDVQPRNAEIIGKSIEYINEHFCENIKLEELAALSNLSATYYGIIFKKLNGITPWEYITTKRIAMAIRLLEEGKCSSMLELANECGFNNTTNFNRAFRKYTGYVPSKYMRYNEMEK